jgi:hypothetical protein
LLAQLKVDVAADTLPSFLSHHSPQA